jgi:hypothetical protein
MTLVPSYFLVYKLDFIARAFQHLYKFFGIRRVQQQAREAVSLVVSASLAKELRQRLIPSPEARLW